MKTLVVILAETRAHELTFQNFQENVLQSLDADLCVCIGVKPNYDRNNPFYQWAKYRFEYPEPDDFATAFDEAYQEEQTQRRQVFETLPDMNYVYGQVPAPRESTSQIVYLGECKTRQDVPWSDYANTYEALVYHDMEFEHSAWRGQLYGIKRITYDLLCRAREQLHVHTWAKPLPWRYFLRIKSQFLGGIQDPQHQHPGSAGILLFFRWFLWQNLQSFYGQYDRIIITRSDFLWQIPHPPLDLLNEGAMWFPDGERYGGLTDRHVVLNRVTVQPYLDILTQMFHQSHLYWTKMRHNHSWNLEQLIHFHLQQHHLAHTVRFFPYVMYSVRPLQGTTRWSAGTLHPSRQYYVKYHTEWEQATQHEKQWLQSGQTFQDYYKSRCILRKTQYGRGPKPLHTLSSTQQKEFTVDLSWQDPQAYLDGTKTTSIGQIPPLCQTFMKRMHQTYEATWTTPMIDAMLQQLSLGHIDALSPSDYPGSALQLMEAFRSIMRPEYSCVVLGSISPWIECLLLHCGVAQVTTIDYALPTCSDSRIRLATHSNTYSTQYDIVVSFSSIEHDGLGRYGDPINPEGDLEAVLEAFAMIKPGGYFVCGIPIGAGCIQGNYHRIYNQKRVNKMFALFETRQVIPPPVYGTISFSGQDWQNQPVFVLQKA